MIETCNSALRVYGQLVRTRLYLRKHDKDTYSVRTFRPHWHTHHFELIFGNGRGCLVCFRGAWALSQMVMSDGLISHVTQFTCLRTRFWYDGFNAALTYSHKALYNTVDFFLIVGGYMTRSWQNVCKLADRKSSYVFVFDIWCKLEVANLKCEFESVT